MSESSPVLWLQCNQMPSKPFLSQTKWYFEQKFYLNVIPFYFFIKKWKEMLDDNQQAQILNKTKLGSD